MAAMTTTKEARLCSLVQCLLENDPNDDAADGVTVLEVWREEAEQVLALPRPTTSPDGAVEVVERRIEKMRPIVRAMPNNEAASVELDTYLSLQRELRALPQPVASNGFAAGVAACVSLTEQRGNEARKARDDYSQDSATVTAAMAAARAEVCSFLVAQFQALSPAAQDDNALVEAATNLHRLADELCEAVDAAGEDIGGHRGSLTILRELGPATDALAEALTTHRENGS